MSSVMLLFCVDLLMWFVSSCVLFLLISEQVLFGLVVSVSFLFLSVGMMLIVLMLVILLFYVYDFRLSYGCDGLFGVVRCVVRLLIIGSVFGVIVKFSLNWLMIGVMMLWFLMILIFVLVGVCCGLLLIDVFVCVCVSVCDVLLLFLICMCMFVWQIGFVMKQQRLVSVMIVIVMLSSSQMLFMMIWSNWLRMMFFFLVFVVRFVQECFVCVFIICFCLSGVEGVDVILVGYQCVICCMQKIVWIVGSICCSMWLNCIELVVLMQMMLSG